MRRAFAEVKNGRSPDKTGIPRERLQENIYKMENKENNKEFTIDIMHILRTLLSRVWIIVIAAVLLGSAGFAYSSFVVSPSYSSQVLLYINNSSVNFGNTSGNITMSDLQASERLVKTYSAILKSRTTLEAVLKNAEMTYTVSQVRSMISTKSVNETEVMKIVVTCGDPYDAALLANSIAEVLPTRVADIIDGASVSVVELAVPNKTPVAPNVFKYTILGFVLGAFAAAVVIAVRAVFDDTLYGEEYILETFDAPILAKVPNLLDLDDEDTGYGYYKAKPSAGAND